MKFLQCLLATVMDVHVDEATGQKKPVISRKRKRRASQSLEMEGNYHQLARKESFGETVAVKKVRSFIGGR